MSIRTETTTKTIRQCDHCRKDLPEDHNKRATLSMGADFDNHHNGDQVRTTFSIDICLKCACAAFPQLHNGHKGEYTEPKDWL